ncbi:phage holin family protein [Clostridium sp. DSM 100503]|uniref:phage holin family protein n=1 Tax=Clostridium sp. DSM 100503 TaxID=2963282 RepID=UPI00214A1007|nr:phage holin family protein [Clostridium sp. DSM 100503]MCR1953170.1 phage holin family protein [Clostridium sp. DSM 100503]
MEILEYIIENALILIPALYVIGLIIKGTEKVLDKYIPVILLVFGIIGAIALLGFNINSIIQGILVTGVTVYANQLIKQANK